MATDKQGWIDAQQYCINRQKEKIAMMCTERDNVRNSYLQDRDEWAAAQQSLIDKEKQELQRMLNNLEQFKEEYKNREEV